MDIKSKIILISGPTASGKSNFAVKLAKKINGEIVSFDRAMYSEFVIWRFGVSRFEIALSR